MVKSNIVTGWFRGAGPGLDDPTTMKESDTLPTGDDVNRMSLQMLEAELREVSNIRVTLQSEDARYETYEECLKDAMAARLSGLGLKIEVIKKG